MRPETRRLRFCCERLVEDPDLDGHARLTLMGVPIDQVDRYVALYRSMSCASAQRGGCERPLVPEPSLADRLRAELVGPARTGSTSTR